jgi:glycosyltransferase involved in cell wall biosynthesis
MLYSVDWTKELLDHERGRVPSHRLFGFAELRELGYRPDLCRTPGRLGGLLDRPSVWRAFQALWAALHQRRYACIVATTETPALPLLVLKAAGLVRRPVVVVSVALLHAKNATGLRGALWARCVRHADALVVYASAQAATIRQRFRVDAARVVFVPFGVDTAYFSPERADQQREGGERFVLAVGTNQGKDFATLVRAMPPGVPLLVVTDAGNAEVIARTTPRGAMVTVDQAVPIGRLRELYRAAAVLVIPLHEAPFSSGQTVLLENMASGRAVVVSDVSGVRDYVQDGVTATVVPPGDVAALRRAIDRALREEAAGRRIGRAAAAAVREEYSARRYADRLAAVISEVATSPKDPQLSGPTPAPVR